MDDRAKAPAALSQLFIDYDRAYRAHQHDGHAGDSPDGGNAASLLRLRRARVQLVHALSADGYVPEVPVARQLARDRTALSPHADPAGSPAAVAA